jgi:hypothetical protein
VATERKGCAPPKQPVPTADHERLRKLLSGAGFERIVIEDLELEREHESVDQWWDGVMASSGHCRLCSRRSLPAPVSRVLCSRPLGIACGAIGVFLFWVVLYAGLRGSANTTENLAPTFVYIVFWLLPLPLGVRFGDVFRAFNPWRAMGRAVGWTATKLAGAPMPAPLAYPERLGRWPAVAGILAFAWLELASPDGASPESVAIAALVYSALTFIGMALYGVEAWTERGEAFGVYFNVVALIALASLGVLATGEGAGTVGAALPAVGACASSGGATSSSVKQTAVRAPSWPSKRGRQQSVRCAGTGGRQRVRIVAISCIALAAASTQARSPSVIAIGRRARTVGDRSECGPASPVASASA